MVNDIIFSDIEAPELESSDEDLDSETDESYHPDADSDSYDSDSETESVSTSATSNFEAEGSTGHKEPKYIVFYNQLLLQWIPAVKKLIYKTFRLNVSENLSKEVLVYHKIFNKINIFCFTKLENL